MVANRLRHVAGNDQPWPSPTNPLIVTDLTFKQALGLSGTRCRLLQHLDPEGLKRYVVGLGR